MTCFPRLINVRLISKGKPFLGNSSGDAMRRTLDVLILPALVHQFVSLREILFGTDQPVLFEPGELA